MALWRLELCDLNGVAIANLSKTATDIHASYRLNRPASLTFRVPSNDRNVATSHTDGYPMLEAGRRIVKGYRLEGNAFALRFAGYVWQTQDEADKDTQHTAATCFDPLQVLTKRLCRDSTGTGVKLVEFTATDGSQILKTLVDRTNLTGDPIVQPSGFATTGLFEVTGTRTVRWEYKTIGDVVTEFTDVFGGFDIAVDPIDGETGYVAQLSCLARRGVYRPDVILSWGIGKSNASNVTRILDTEPTANLLVGLGGNLQGADQLATAQRDTTSGTSYLVREDVASFTDVTNSTLLSNLVTSELAFRRVPSETVTVQPMLGAVSPWNDLWLGDTFRVAAGPALRGGFTGIQRCYGIDLDIGDVERVTQIVSRAE